jgi:hypothetical protein
MIATTTLTALLLFNKEKVPNTTAMAPETTTISLRRTEVTLSQIESRASALRKDQLLRVMPVSALWRLPPSGETGRSPGSDWARYGLRCAGFGALRQDRHRIGAIR